MEPRSRRPKTAPTKLSGETKDEAVKVRAALESSGLDHGPISVHDKMKALGLAAPSPASLARIFREWDVARNEPKKKPRASYRRCVYPAPNACWQLDATEYVLTGGRKCVIFQLQDDHSRLAVATHVAGGETSEAPLEVVKKGIAAHGVPQWLPTDSGAVLNPSRRGWEGQLVIYVSSLGVQAITGKPYQPTTQGTNERFHQTVFRWLDKQPLAATHEELQDHVDRFDAIYNTERPHQGLPGRITPKQAWDATEIAEAPRPAPPEGNAPEVRPITVAQHLIETMAQAEAAAVVAAADAVEETTLETSAPRKVTGSITQPSGSGSQKLKVCSNGVVNIGRTIFSVTASMSGRTVIASRDAEGVIFANSQGEIIADYAWPPKGTGYIGVTRSRTPFGNEKKSGQPPPKS